MEPGDIVYYGENAFIIFVLPASICWRLGNASLISTFPCAPVESAKALHGRNTPLQGGNYINLFTHYRPLDDPEWFLRDTPEGTPEPLIDVGECHLAGELDQYSQGTIKCENDAIGPHLSPTMFTARNGNDLFNWWKTVGPDGVEGGVGDGDEL